MITLTKTQLQKLLRALEAQETSEAVPTPAAVPTITAALNKLPISGDDCLPSWVRRNSTAAARDAQQSSESSLTGFPRRLSNSHPELGTAPSRPFSKLAQKQLQWEKERAEMQDWNPWGRPGGGAPRCQPVAAVPPRTGAQVLRVQAATAASSTGAYPSRAPSPPSLPQLPSNGGGGGMSPTFVRRVPPYLRSQLPFGPSCDLREDEKEETKRRWLQELECQREENQRRRQMDNHHMYLSNGSCWADSESLGSDKVTRPGDDGAESVWSLARGQGGRPGTDTKAADSEERRERALAYQRAIQAQMQEKQQRQRAEREARIREEREQERRLEEDRRRMELQYQEEQRRQREKQEREEKTRLLLIAKMQQAAAEAEAVRKAKRSQKLHQLAAAADCPDPQLSNFDTTASMDADFSTSLDQISSSVMGMSNVGSEEQTDLSAQQNLSSARLRVPPAPLVTQAQSATAAATAAVRPLRSGANAMAASGSPQQQQREMWSQTDESLPPSVCSSSRCSGLSSAGLVQLGPYVENRVLTPTKVRIAHHALLLRCRPAPCREFGCQTDISLPPCGWGRPPVCHPEEEEEEEEEPGHNFENRGHLREFPPYTSAVRRLQHSLPLRGVHRSPPGGRSPPSGRKAAHRTEPGAAGRQGRPAVTRGRVANVLPAAVPRSSAQRMEEVRRHNWEREVETRRLRALAELQAKGARGRAAERNRGRGPVRAAHGQTPHHFEEETAHNSTQSDEEEEENTASRNFSHHRAIQSPPIPALRGKLLLPSPRSKQHDVSNPAADTSSEPTANTPAAKACHGTPPASRKRWRRQEVYVPQQPFGDAVASKESDSPQDHSRVNGTPAGDGRQLGFVERQRSVSVSGARRNQSPSPDRRQQRASSQDPLVHPELVTGCPTRRQDKILQQLFTLRQGLLVKQREMESHLVKVKP